MSQEFADLGIGVGLRPAHYDAVLSQRPSAVKWFEVISENFMGLRGGNGGGRPLERLLEIRRAYPIVLHGVSLSIGSTAVLDLDYLKRLQALIQTVEPAWVSDHICWTGVRGRNTHDLLPLPYTKEALEHVAGRVHEVQDFLGRPLVLENVSSYVSFRDSEMTEWDFLNALCRRTGCRLLLDVNNVFVSASNHGFDPHEYLAAIERESVVQFHLAGHTKTGTLLIDTHDAPVCEEVWHLFEAACRRFGARSTLIEWDERIPEYSVLVGEAKHARQVRQSALGITDEERALETC